ncbi:MAG: serine hydrolase domain-containing protein, partial [Chloroflexota bacterium]
HGPMWTEYDAPERDEFVSETSLRQPTRPPYDQYAYSNLGYSLLGDIIAAVSGQSWADYIQQNILDPLDMSETFPVPKADDPQLAKGYSRLSDAYERSAMTFFLMNSFEASANIASSVNDLVKYANFHLNKDKSPILSNHSLRDMHRIHWIYDKWDGGYGLGIEVHKVNDWIITGHTGGYPGYITAFMVCQKQNTAVIVLTNALNSNPMQYVEQAYKLVLPEIIKATEAAKPKANPVWEKYAGEYIGDWGSLKVVIRGEQLQIISLDYMDMPPTILIPTPEENVFTLQEAHQSNETARFEMNAEGKVVKLWTRNEYYSIKKTSS